MKGPFGLLFAEALVAGEKPPRSVYDDEKDLSMIKDKEGKLVPIVANASWALGTFTETRAMGEHTDAD